MNERRSFLAGILTLPWAAKTLAGGGDVSKTLYHFQDFTMSLNPLFFEGETTVYSNGIQLNPMGALSPCRSFIQVMPAEHHSPSPPLDTASMYDTLVINLYPSSNIISQVLS